MTKSHPVEAYDTALIARAHHFTAFQFRGRGQRHKVDDIPNLTLANAAALELLAEFGGRPVLIYAVDADGKQALSHTVTA